MQIIAEVPIPQSQSQMQYITDRDELLRLLEAKLIQDRLYVYLALAADQNRKQPIYRHPVILLTVGLDAQWSWQLP